MHESLKEALRSVPLTRTIAKELRARRTYYSKVGQKPKEALIEVTNICNLDCTMCYSRQASRPKGLMEMETYRKAIAQVVELGVADVHLYTVGEPLLHPKIAEMVRIAKGEGCRVFIFTNGALLTADAGLGLISAGLDCLTFSVEGCETERYEKSRKGAKFTRLLENVSRFRELRDENGGSPRIEVWSAIANESKEELVSFSQFWRRYADNVNLVYLANQGGYIEGIHNSQVLPPVADRRPCSSLWTSIVVLWNGDVSACCVDFDGKLVVGNIFSGSLKQIWFGSTYRKFRLSHLRQDFGKVPRCGGCDAGLINITSQVKELNETLDNRFPRWLDGTKVAV